MSEKDLGTYQMLWDCAYCGTAKLLGKTHRHCPACGSAQDPERRYFPSEEDKVAVEDHVFSGADRTCPACTTPMAAAATHCAGCGSAMDGSAQVALKRDPAEEVKTPPAEPALKKKSKIGCVIGCVLLALVLAVVAAAAVIMLWKKQAAVQVAGHSWERSIQIEEYRSVKDDAWCDEMPSAAHDVTRTKEVRSHKKVEDGEDCTVKKKDQGDGTFKEVQECKPRYREEPVYDQKCKYTVEKWTADRTAEESGAGLSDTPSWPAVKLAKTGTCVGCEREGARSEEYTVHFVDDGGKDLACDLSQAAWGSFAVGSSWSGEVGVVTGKLDCDSLLPAG